MKVNRIELDDVSLVVDPDLDQFCRVKLVWIDVCSEFESISEWSHSSGQPIERVVRRPVSVADGRRPGVPIADRYIGSDG